MPKIPQQTSKPGSKITKVPRQNQKPGSKIPRIPWQNQKSGPRSQDPSTKSLARIQDFQDPLDKITSQDPRSPGYLDKIWSAWSNIPQEPESWILQILDPGSFWDLATSLAVVCFSMFYINMLRLFIDSMNDWRMQLSVSPTCMHDRNGSYQSRYHHAVCEGMWC